MRRIRVNGYFFGKCCKSLGYFFFRYFWWRGMFFFRLEFYNWWNLIYVFLSLEGIEGFYEKGIKMRF